MVSVAPICTGRASAGARAPGGASGRGGSASLPRSCPLPLIKGVRPLGRRPPPPGLVRKG